MKPRASSAGRKTRGNTTVEFTLAGIPLVFVLISTVEMCRGMMAYNSLGHTVREATRLASRSGENCLLDGNDCATSVSGMAARIQTAASGIPAQDLSVTLNSAAGARSCSPVTACLEDDSLWPPEGANATGAEITVTASYSFRSAITMLWPGGGSADASRTFVLEASSTERIQF